MAVIQVGPLYTQRLQSRKVLAVEDQRKSAGGQHLPHLRKHTDILFGIEREGLDVG